MTRPPALLLNQTRPWGRPEDGDDAVDVALELIRSGWDGAGFADSPRLFPDPWLQTQRVLSATSVSLAGPCVASLGLRHPVTVAGAIRTLNSRHPGRAIAVVGRGESSVKNEGLTPPSLREYSQTLHQLRAMVDEGGGVTEPLIGAASGPRTITATCQALDAVLLDVGVDHRVVTSAVALARREAPAATVWVFLRAVVATSPQELVAAAQPLIGSCAARLVAAPEWFGLSDDELDAVREVARSHDYRKHGTASARAGTTSDADRLVRDRFLLAGTGEDITAHLRPLAGLGISGVVVAGAVPGVTDRLPELGAALRAGLGTEAVQ